jgi:Tol biopolymer transport system component
MDSIWNQVHVTTSDTGVMAYVPGSDRSVGRLAWVDRTGRTEFLQTPPRLYGVVALSPNGKKLAAHVADVTDYVWMYDLSRRESFRLPAGEHAGFPAWGPDNRTVAFATWSSWRHKRIVSRTDDSDALRELMGPGEHHPTSFSDGGGRLAVSSGGTAVVILTPDGAAQRFETRGVPMPTLSPDGRFVAYGSQETGQSEISVRSVADTRIVRQVSTDGGLEPRWCGCGELFYRKANRWMSVKIRTTPKLHWEPAQHVFHTDFVDTLGLSYDISPDGQRLLIVKRATPDIRTHLNLITNWTLALQSSRR